MGSGYKFWLHFCVWCCFQFRLEDVVGIKIGKSPPAQWYFKFWFSSIHLLPFTFQSPKIPVSCILSRFYSCIQLVEKNELCSKQNLTNNFLNVCPLFLQKFNRRNDFKRSKVLMMYQKKKRKIRNNRPKWCKQTVSIINQWPKVFSQKFLTGQDMVGSYTSGLELP